MTPEEHFRHLEAIYAAAPCNAYYEPRLAVSEGRAEIVIAVKPDFLHSAGAVHGSVYFKALDDAAFFSANSVVPDVFVLTSSFQLYLLGPITGGEMRAVGQLVHQAKNHFIAESVLYDAARNEVARGSGSFIKSKIPLKGLPSRGPLR